ncbi:MAG TPA: hypothetical protein VJB66_04600 [Candidatus Nanoarchaeia archaeon]|nr:hypothetical protein [Candidatus Nanoarchaeia archaeon]
MEIDKWLMGIMFIMIMLSLLFVVQGQLLQGANDELVSLLLGNGKTMAGVYLLLLGNLVGVILLPYKLSQLMRKK